MKFLIIYLVGVAVASIGALMHEIYLYGGEIRKISAREIVEDLAISLFSWLAVFIEFAMAVMNVVFGFENYNKWPLREKFVDNSFDE